MEVFPDKVRYDFDFPFLLFVGRCEEEKIVAALDEIYYFKSIDVGEKQNYSCIYGQTDAAKLLNKTTK